MDSIDDYQKKKEERKVQLFGSPIATSTVMKQKTNSHAKTSSIFPSANKIAKKTDHSAKVETSVNCSTAKNSTKNVRRSSNRLMSPLVFRAQVTSTKNMDLNFAKSTLSSTKLTFSKQATKTSTKNIDKTKTTCSESAARMAIVNDVKFSAKKFPSTGNNTTLSSTNVHQPARNKFDLAASLEKPLTWVPYSGKVKPLATHDEEPVKYLKTKVVASLRDKELKEVKVKTRLTPDMENSPILACSCVTQDSRLLWNLFLQPLQDFTKVCCVEVSWLLERFGTFGDVVDVVSFGFVTIEMDATVGSYASVCFLSFYEDDGFALRFGDRHVDWESIGTSCDGTKGGFLYSLIGFCSAKEDVVINVWMSLLWWPTFPHLIVMNMVEVKKFIFKLLAPELKEVKDFILFYFTSIGLTGVLKQNNLKRIDVS
ncbi:hypothetical protein HELRODRAFT_165312 [Helobdella robusta]|uniref:Uncharacterized protein n=1 Tax=Helobdella robusta TaxID=6412 RepID=T1EWK9_HELRO|nr:hypothetical protein HELRODRAFT_165312 [Helobdella robusta]ESN91303.1 hypothetical protein HELRODRAFT_165312 [Helobdella robusta]